ncbi:DUF2278 family protein [Nonomuraea sp. NPDC004186]
MAAGPLRAAVPGGRGLPPPRRPAASGQGNSGRFRSDDRVWQDGGLLLHFPGASRCIAVFLACQSQAWHTDDRTGHASRPRPPGPPAAANRRGLWPRWSTLTDRRPSARPSHRSTPRPIRSTCRAGTWQTGRAARGRGHPGGAGQRSAAAGQQRRRDHPRAGTRRACHGPVWRCEAHPGSPLD